MGFMPALGFVGNVGVLIRASLLLQGRPMVGPVVRAGDSRLVARLVRRSTSGS